MALQHIVTEDISLQRHFPRSIVESSGHLFSLLFLVVLHTYGWVSLKIELKDDLTMTAILRRSESSKPMGSAFAAV